MNSGGLQLFYNLRSAYKRYISSWKPRMCSRSGIRLCAELMRAIGNVAVREALWEEQHWKGTDEERDQKLTFVEIFRLCRRLNIDSNQEDLFRLFTGRVECFPFPITSYVHVLIG